MTRRNPSRRSNERAGSAASSRGQTSVDLVVGLTLFLVTVTVVLGQLPSFLAPYQGQSTPVVAERAADEVVNELVATEFEGDTSPTTLSESCTVAFLSGYSDDDCGFDETKSVRERLGLSALYGVNVSLVHQGTDVPGTELFYHDDGQLTDSGSEPLRAGAPVPEDDQSVVVVYRGVRVNDEWALVVVRVWSR